MRLKFSSLLLLAGILAMPIAANAAESKPSAVKAWFTQADIKDSVQLSKPADTLPEALGTAGKGVILTKPLGIENPLLDQKTGYISFWVKPNWNGNDGKSHKLIRIGDPAKNGLLVEKSSEGMLRYVMASQKKITASRADVTTWKAGQWHHIVVTWFSLNDKPLGLPLWIDKVAVDGPIAGGNTFLNPAEMKDKKVYIGDSTSEAIIDELIFRNSFKNEEPNGQLAQVYRDYFRTAPYTKISVDANPCYAAADPRVVEGHEKQFGLFGEFEKKPQRVTDFVARYGNWADFDAKPLINWTSSNEKIATVDKNGLVTGKAVGKCKLTAEFRGMKASYSVEVTPVDQADLDLAYVARLPRYPANEVKDRPDPGEKVESVAHIFNFGFKPVPAGTVVRFELIPDLNRNFELDSNERATQTQEQTISKIINPKDESTVSFTWAYTNDPVFVRVTVDPNHLVPEFCKANNQKCDLNIAHGVRFGINPKQYAEEYDSKKINLVGSFSRYDWINAQLYRFNVMLHQQVYPETSPNGIQMSCRADNFYVMKWPGDASHWEQEQYVIDEKYYDGGYPDLENVNLLQIDCGYLHEFGHVDAMLPDLYGYPVQYWSVLLKDENGKLYAGSDLLPRISTNDGVLPYSSANDVPCGVGYNSLMNFCHLWIHPANAGQTNYFGNFRGDRFWGTQGRLIPLRESFLKVLDVNDEPLTGAAVYVYQVIQTNAQDAGTKFFPDRVKFMGNVDKNGWWKIPGDTDPSWDDPDSDEVEGSVPVWNPFTRNRSTNAFPDTAFTPNVWCVEGLLLLKIVSGDQTELQWLPLTEFNRAFFRGEKFRGTYTIRTSLSSSKGITPLVKQVIPEAIQKINKKPTAVAPETITVKAGQPFTIDGSKSSDPEGQPLIYRWHIRTRAISPDFSDEPIYKGMAPKDAGEFEAWFYVIDGLRVSEPVKIKIIVEK